MNICGTILEGLGAAKMGSRFSSGVLDLTYNNLSKGEESKSSQGCVPYLICCYSRSKGKCTSVNKVCKKSFCYIANGQMKRRDAVKQTVGSVS